MEYLSISQTAKKWDLSTRRIQVLCNEGRIPGAIKIGYAWVVPINATKPADARVKSGKYIKTVNCNNKLHTFAPHHTCGVKS